jgi:NADH dehydrogenase FAD-containing subunit
MILGAGYAGLTAAKVLAKRTPAMVTLINESARFQERMRNHQVAAGQELRRISIQDLVRRTNIKLVIDRVSGIDLTARQVLLASGHEPVRYDILVYALGSRGALDDVPGAAEHATPVATWQDAQRLHQQVGNAGVVAVVGGGLTGIETATELAEAYPDRQVKLITRGKPGPMLNERAHDHLDRVLDRLQIEVVPNATVAKVAQDGLLLTDGRHIDADTTAWTAGFAVPSLAQQAGLAVDHRGRMLVDPTLRSLSHREVYGVGDAAAARNEDGEEVRMGCGPGGIAGVAGALAIADRLDERMAKPYRYHDVAWYISLGRRDGLMQFGGPDEPGRLVTGRLAAYLKEWVALRGSVLGLRHSVVAIAGAKSY